MFIYETRDIFAKEEEQEAKSYKGVVFCSNDNQLPAEVGQEVLIVPADNPVSIVATVEEKPNGGSTPDPIVVATTMGSSHNLIYIEDGGEYSLAWTINRSTIGVMSNLPLNFSAETDQIFIEKNEESDIDNPPYSKSYQICLNTNNGSYGTSLFTISGNGFSMSFTLTVYKH